MYKTKHVQEETCTRGNVYKWILLKEETCTRGNMHKRKHVQEETCTRRNMYKRKRVQEEYVYKRRVKRYHVSRPEDPSDRHQFPNFWLLIKQMRILYLWWYVQSLRGSNIFDWIWAPALATFSRPLVYRSYVATSSENSACISTEYNESWRTMEWIVPLWSAQLRDLPSLGTNTDFSRVKNPMIAWIELS